MNCFDVFNMTKLSTKKAYNGNIRYEFSHANTVNSFYLNEKERELLRVQLQKEFIHNKVKTAVNEFELTYDGKITKEEFISAMIDMYDEYISLEGGADEELNDRINQLAIDNEMY